MEIKGVYYYKHQLSIKNKENESLKKSLRVHIDLLDTYRMEIHELKYIVNKLQISVKRVLNFNRTKALLKKVV